MVRRLPLRLLALEIELHASVDLAQPDRVVAALELARAFHELPPLPLEARRPAASTEAQPQRVPADTQGCCLPHIRLQPSVPTAAAPATYGCSPCYIRLQPPAPAVAASSPYGCSPCYIRLQPLLPTVADPAPYGCRPCYLRLQPLLPTVAASVPYGCSLRWRTWPSHGGAASGASRPRAPLARRAR